MSTSLLVNKMKEAAAALGKDYEIAAHPVSEFETYGPVSDAILIGPQIRFVMNDLVSKYPDLKIKDIPMKMYGMMDGKGALGIAMEMMGEE